MSELVNIGSICENVLRYWRRYRYGVISVGFSEGIGRAGSELIKAGGRTAKLECCIRVTNYPDIDVRKTGVRLSRGRRRPLPNYHCTVGPSPALEVYDGIRTDVFVPDDQ